MLNKTSFKQLFDSYFDAVRSYIFYRCGDAEEASDMAQDIFMKVWEKRETLLPDNLKALLYKMANDMTVSNYRKLTGRIGFVREMKQQQPVDRSPEDEALYRETVSGYAAALEKMTQAQRTVFLMSRNDALKYHEIAARLDISVKTVEKRMSAALQLLRKELL
jgi:RNA polymerase sigma-70 factor (ECF subfamily)